jgi:thymidine kinase
MAKLYYVYGPMNVSKSASLLMKAHSFENNNIPFICIKSSIDDRDEGIIKSRVGIERECLSIDIKDDIYRIIKVYNNPNKPLKWILVDESQFLTSEQVDQLAKIVDELNINVMCYGLRTDFKTKLFDGSRRLFELADNIEEMKVSCKCGRKAIINARVDNNGDVVNEGEQIMTGGNERYVTMCRKCYSELINKK